MVHDFVCATSFSKEFGHDFHGRVNAGKEHPKSGTEIAENILAALPGNLDICAG